MLRSLLSSLRARLRTPGGYADNTAGFRPVVLAMLVLFALAGVAFAAEAPTTVALPSVNMNGYTSETVFVNASDDLVLLPTACRVGPCALDAVRPRSAFKRKRVDFGTDITTAPVDARMRVYAKVWTPLGHYAIVPPLPLLAGRSYLYDLADAELFASYVWIAVAPGQEGRYITIEDPGVPRDNEFGRRELQAYELGRGAIIERVWGPTVKIHLGALPGWPALPAPSGIYAFAFDVHLPTGAIEARVTE